MLEQQIPCPDCGTAISFDTQGLMQGRGYTCAECTAEIVLSKPQPSTFRDASGPLEKLKATLEKNGGAACAGRSKDLEEGTDVLP